MSSSVGAGSSAGAKGYGFHLAGQTDAAKYRTKYKMLKKKVRQIEQVSRKGGWFSRPGSPSLREI